MARLPLPIYFEDNHAGTLQFLASTLELGRPHVLVLVDAHADSSTPPDLKGLREGLLRAASPEERDARIGAWRRRGAVQAFDWITPLMPTPLQRVVWVRPGAGDGHRSAARLPPGFETSSLENLEAHLPPDLPVVATFDLDSFAGLPSEEAALRFARHWARVVRLRRLSAITFAISRPWLSDDGEASRLVFLALQAALSLPHATIRFEPWGIEGPDRSERAKAFYRKRREPPRFDPEVASPELRGVLLGNADRLDVQFDPTRWRDLLGRWRAETREWQVALSGVDLGSDGILRPEPGTLPDLRVEGGLPGAVRRVTWLAWTPRSWTYNILPEIPLGKDFAGASPPVVEYQSTVLARSESVALGAEAWMSALPGPGRSGVVRISAEVETELGTVHTARVEIRRGIGSGFRAGISEQFGLPYVFGAGFLRRGGLTGPDTGVGSDCANFLIYGWRRSGIRIPWSDPARLRRHLTGVADSVRATDGIAIPPDVEDRGLVVHLGSHVAALWEDRPPLGTLGPEDLVVHHLGGAPEVTTLGRLLEDRAQPVFDLYLGPAREPAAWVAVGGDTMPGRDMGAPPGLGSALRRADLAVANLETTVGTGGTPARKRYVFRIPAARLADLSALGFRAFSLANNHAGDFGAEGLDETLGALDAKGLGHFGAGRDVASAVSAWRSQVGGMTVAFVGVSLTDPDLLPAGTDQAGLAVLPRHQRELAEAIATARATAPCVVVLPHWGREGFASVTEEQRRWARWLVQQGADAVVGSGPHVVQAHEIIAGVPVFYSVGNLWFEGTWAKASDAAGLAFIGLDRSGRVVATRLERLPAEADPLSAAGGR